MGRPPYIETLKAGFCWKTLLCRDPPEVSRKRADTVESFVVSPHPQHLDHTFFLKDLVHKSVLNVDPAGE